MYYNNNIDLISLEYNYLILLSACYIDINPNT